MARVSFGRHHALPSASARFGRGLLSVGSMATVLAVMAFGTLTVSWGATGEQGGQGKAPSAAGKPSDADKSGDAGKPNGAGKPDDGKPDDAAGGDRATRRPSPGGGQEAKPAPTRRSPQPGGQGRPDQTAAPGGDDDGGQTGKPGGGQSQAPGGGKTQAPGGGQTRAPGGGPRATGGPPPTDPDPTTGPPNSPGQNTPDPGGQNPDPQKPPKPTTKAPQAPRPANPPVVVQPSQDPGGNPGGPGSPGGPVSPGSPGSTDDTVAPGVTVTTRDVTLTPAYWSAPSTSTELRITVANSRPVTQMVEIRYTLPEGVTDAGTPDCSPAGDRTWLCKPWAVMAQSQGTSRIRVAVDGGAWEKIPLSGLVEARATIPGSGRPAVVDQQGFAVLFPAGPPVPGVSLTAGDVTFDITGQPTTLQVKLGNTGQSDATGAVEVVLPEGVSVPTLPAGCVAVNADRTRCDLGSIPAGQDREIRLPVTATPDAQRVAPLSGAVLGTLTPLAGSAKRVQMSFRIDAMAATSGSQGPAPAGSQGAIVVADRSETTDLASGGTTVTLIAVSVLLVMLALALATTSLRRGLRARAAARAARPATATTAIAPVPTASVPATPTGTPPGR